MLVAVAHGSRDPRSAAVVRELVAALPGARPAFLGLSEPLLSDVLAELRALGQRQVVVVPLLLGTAYHALVDIPAIVAGESALSIRVTEVIGGDPRLADAALARLAEIGVRPGDRGVGVVLAAAGSSHAAANAAVADLAADWARSYGWVGVRAAFATSGPTVAEAVADLRARGARRIAVASWFLAPGFLPDRIAAQARAADPDVLLASPLGAHPLVVAAVADLHLSLPV